MNSKGFWYFLMAGAVGLWVEVLLAAILVPSISMIAWIVFIALAALHVLEFPLISKKRADGKVSQDVPPSSRRSSSALHGGWL
jgi:hypothetical protein